MTRRSERIRAAGALTLVAVVAAACGASSADQLAAAPELAAVERRSLDIRAEAAGLVEPIRVVEVKSKASGEILRMLVETGDEVKRGALLAEVDPRDVRNALAQAEADLEVARARLATAEAQRARTEALRQSNVATEQEYEQSALEEANARAQLVKAQTNLELARERMGDVTITAPIDGTVIQKDVEAGQIIASASSNVSGGTTLLLMADLSEMQVRTLIDETDIGRIQPGQTARVTVEAFPDRAFLGRVFKIEPQAVVEQNVTMFPVLVRLENREGLLKPGMNAEVEVEIARRDDVVAVPNAAVVSMPDAPAAAAVLGVAEDAFPAGSGFGRGGPSGWGGRPGSGGGRAGPARPDGEAGSEAAPPAGALAAGAPGEECMALRERFRGGGRPPTEEDRALMQRCRAAMGGRAGGPGRPEDARPGVVFVAGPNGPEPRTIMLGLNDWEFTEVLGGVEPGDQVYLLSVARVQQEQEQMMQRFRQRAGGFGGGPAIRMR